MKINNEYIKISIGKKQIKKQNFFFNKYLKNFSKAQISSNNYENFLNRKFSKVYIKLNTPIQKEIDYDNPPLTSDFELQLFIDVFEQTTNKNTINVYYNASDKVKFIYNNETFIQNKKILDGCTITAVAFGNDEEVFTFLDTSEYGLVIIEDEILNISRKDVIFTETIIENFEYPAHLSVENIYLDNKICYPKIYSVGLGYQAGKMKEEYIIGEDIEIFEESDTIFSFVLKKASDIGLYPGVNVFGSSKKFPLTFKIKTSKYPNQKLYSNNNLFPTLGDFKYIILKYKFYYINEQAVSFDADVFYTASFYSEKEGLLTIKNKIERIDKNVNEKN